MRRTEVERTAVREAPGAVLDPASRTPAPPSEGLLAVDEARARIVAAVTPIADSERVALDSALGRVVAESIVATCDVPPADNSAMDGFAFRLSDLRDADGVLPITGRMAAGQPATTLAPGGASWVFTGAVVPRGADTVVRLEDCQVDGATVRVLKRDVRLGDEIRRAGEDVVRGAEVIAAGTRMRAQELGVAASVGVTHVAVRRAVRVALVVTGDELVEPGAALESGKIYDSNGPVLAALLRTVGCLPGPVVRVRDDLAATRDALVQAAASADLVISSGGVSVGQEDHVKTAMRAIGEVDLWQVAVKPGKPIGFGRIAGVPWLGLPGNPVSGFVMFMLFGVPLLRRLQGREPTFPQPLRLPAGFERQRTLQRDEYQRVRVEDGRLVPYPRQGSGVLSSASWSDGLAKVPARASVSIGDELEYLGYAELLG